MIVAVALEGLGQIVTNGALSLYVLVNFRDGCTQMGRDAGTWDLYQRHATIQYQSRSQYVARQVELGVMWPMERIPPEPDHGDILDNAVVR